MDVYVKVFVQFQNAFKHFKIALDGLVADIKLVFQRHRVSGSVLVAEFTECLLMLFIRKYFLRKILHLEQVIILKIFAGTV